MLNKVKSRKSGKTVKVKTIVTVITMMLLGITATYAQKNPHNVGVAGKGPHGGTVQEADPKIQCLLRK